MPSSEVQQGQACVSWTPHPGAYASAHSLKDVSHSGHSKSVFQFLSREPLDCAILSAAIMSLAVSVADSPPDRAAKTSKTVRRDDRFHALSGGRCYSPVCDRAVPPVIELPPPKIRLAELRDLCELFEIQFNPEAGSVVRIELALLEIEAHRYVRQLASLVVVFHHHWPGERAQRVNQCRGCDRPGEMRRYTYEVGFAQRSNLVHLGDPANIGKRRPEKVDVVILYQRVEIPAISPLLAGRYRHSHFPAQDREVLLKGFGPHRIFHKKRSEILDCIAAPNGVGQVEALMEIDAPISVLSHTLPHLRAYLGHGSNAFPRVIDRVDGNREGVKTK